MTDQISNPAEQIIKQVLNSWAAQNKGVDNFFAKYEDDIYTKEVAPTRNRAIYLLGHLIAVNDGLSKLLGLGDRLFPEYDAIFITAADKTVAPIPTFAVLKQQWETLNATLTERFNKLTTAEWLDRHTAVSEEDFKLEPFRNKLNVMLSRLNHQSYHLGQLNLLVP